jgi:hypothetical protein
MAGKNKSSLAVVLLLALLSVPSCTQDSSASKEYIAEIDRRMSELANQIQSTIDQNDLRAATGDALVDTGPARKELEDLRLKKLEYLAKH